jgi:hypothetical protein
VCIAEVALAERALEAGMRPAVLDAAETGPVPLLNTFAIFEVDGEVVALFATCFAGADGFMVFHEVGVFLAKISAAVLAGVD